MGDGGQPAPVPNDRPAVWPQVIADMQARDAEGRRRYGVPLQPHNGRDALRDAYEEALDLAAYLKQALLERDEAVRAAVAKERERWAGVADRHAEFHRANLARANAAGRHSPYAEGQQHGATDVASLIREGGAP